MKLLATKVDNNSYVIAAGYKLAREYDTYTPNGNRLGGRWALRDQSEKLIDYDRYINDLAERYNIDLYNANT